MKYEQAGTHEIEYKAVDECGNETTETRTITIIDNTPLHTVLYTDGTLIINEHESRRSSNTKKYGNVIQEYVPLDENNNYNFTTGSQRPWHNELKKIKSVKFGSTAKPVSIAYWFQADANLESIDFANFDGSEVTNARAFVASTAITSLTLPEMPKLEMIRYICNKCESLTKVDMSNMKSTVLTDTQDAFQGCYALTEVDLSSNSGTIAICDRMFANVANDGKGDMQITTIYASEGLDFSQATSSGNMFRTDTSLVGGNGTVFDSSYIGKQYARIDKDGQPGYFTAKE